MFEHTWVPKTEDPHPFWEERHCSTCHLEDMRAREGKVRRSWSVTTPCIDPVVDAISFDDLLAEMNEHKVKETVHFEGRPGAWSIGFSKGYNYPHLRADNIEECCAMLLRWLRARQYDPHKYSDFAYQTRLAEPERHYDD